MDSLRGTMMLLGILFHTIYFLSDRENAAPKDAYAYTIPDLLIVLLHSFRMPLFFLAAGFFAALLRDRHGTDGMLRNRLWRVVVPLAVGWLVLVPLTRGAEHFLRNAKSSGSALQGLATLGQGDWLRWDKVYHLWFLAALLAFYLAALLLRLLVLRLEGAPLGRLVEMTRCFLASPWRPLGLALIITGAITAVGLIPNKVLQHDFFIAGLPIFFFVGWTLYAQADLLLSQRRHAWTYVVVGLAALPLVFWANRTLLAGSAAVDQRALVLIAPLSASIMTSFLAFGLLGLFLTYCERPNWIMRYLSDASYWVYLVHLPLILIIGGLLATTALPEGPRLALTVLLALPILLLSYHLCVRFTAIGAVLNGRKPIRPPDLGGAVRA
jgi:glucan biosynthesis protein C